MTNHPYVNYSCLIQPEVPKIGENTSGNYVFEKMKSTYFSLRESVQGKLISSSKIMNNNFELWENDQKNYLMKISKNYTHKYFESFLNKIEKTEVNLIGEVIIDKYVFVRPEGLTSKDPAMSMISNNSEIIPGGVLAVAEILSNFVGQVNLYTATNSNLLKRLKKKKNIKIIKLDHNIKISPGILNKILSNNY